MPAVLNLKPEEIDSAEKRGKYSVCIVGCGQKGIAYAMGFAEAGFKVICTDANQSLVKRVMKGKYAFFDRETEAKLKVFLNTGTLSATNELKHAVARSDIVVLTIVARIDDKKHADFSEAENACRQVGVALRQGVLVVYAGTVSLGFMQGVVKDALENASGLKAGADFALACCAVLTPAKPLPNTELLVAAGDEPSLESAASVLSTLTKKNVKKTLNLITAETAALFASSRRDVNTALSNELAVLCENAGVDYFEAIQLLDVCGWEPEVSPAIAELDEKNDLYVLLENAENFNGKLRLSALARRINEDMIKHGVYLTQEVLRSCGKSLRRAKIAVLGSAGVIACLDFVKVLEGRGAKVSLYDPAFSKNATAEQPSVLRRSLNEAVEGADCVVIFLLHDQFRNLSFKSCHALMRASPAIVDLVGMFKPSMVEGEGFIYRGLGRGTGKK